MDEEHLLISGLPCIASLFCTPSSPLPPGQDFLSNYHGTNTLVDSHSPLAAAASRGLAVTYARGCNICDVVPPGFPNMPCPPGDATNTSGFAAAAAAAAAADVA